MAEQDGAHGSVEPQERPLAGGRTTAGVVRVEDTVRRPLRPWTTSVHAVLRHLERVGFTDAPRVLGVDDSGREVLTYLDGETVADALPWPEWVASDDALVQVDWDVAGPSSRELDLAYAALMWVPLLAPGSAWPVACHPVGETRRRLHVLLDAYGYAEDRSQLRSAVVTRARTSAAVVRQLADRGDPAFEALRSQGDDLDRAARHVEHLPESSWLRPGSTGD